MLLGRVRAGELKPGCTILLESKWRDDTDPRIASSYTETFDQLVGAGYRVIEIPMERECKKAIEDARRGKNMFALGVLCNIFSLDMAMAREQVALTFRKKSQEVIDSNIVLLDAGHAWAEEHLDFKYRIPAAPS